MKVYWRDGRTIVIEARHEAGQHALVYEYDHLNSTLKKTKISMTAKPAPRPKLVPEDLKPVSLDTLDDRMLLHKQVPLDVSYQSLKQAMPQLGTLRHEGGRDLTEARLLIEVLGYQAEVEFNFKNEMLYSYYYQLGLNSRDEANAAYQKLQDYYSRFYGASEQETVQESSHYAVESSFWKTEEVEVSVVNNISPGSHNISWVIKQ